MFFRQSIYLIYVHDILRKYALVFLFIVLPSSMIETMEKSFPLSSRSNSFDVIQIVHYEENLVLERDRFFHRIIQADDPSVLIDAEK